MLKQRDIDREVLLKLLTQGICKVYFTKITNGQFRSLYCTLVPSVMPSILRKGIKGIFDPSTPNVDLLPVYDVVDHSWKSFRVSYVIFFYSAAELKESATENRKVKQIESYL